MKRYFISFIFTAVVLMTVIMMPDTVFAADAVFTDHENGVVDAVCTNDEKVDVKIVVQKDGGKQYKYDVPVGDNTLSIPLTQGNGDYRIYLVKKNTTNSKYAVLQSKVFTLSLEDDNIAFLTSSVIIDWDTTNDAIKKAKSLTSKSKNADQKLNAIYDYIVKNYSYDYDKSDTIDEEYANRQYIPDIDSTYSTKDGICYDISVLFASMLRSVDIPAKVVTGFTPNATTYHAWNNVYYAKKKDWKVVDATYDLQMYAAKKKYTMFKNAKDYSQIEYTY